MLQKTMASTDKERKRVCSEKEIPALLGETAIVRLLGLSRTRVHGLLRSNVLPLVSKGTRKYVRKKELLAWLSSLEGGQNGKTKETQ